MSQIETLKVGFCINQKQRLARCTNQSQGREKLNFRTDENCLWSETTPEVVLGIHLLTSPLPDRLFCPTSSNAIVKTYLCASIDEMCDVAEAIDNDNLNDR
eukprot:scaffold24801_cov181-Cylindrotheca_fusiformis.AAC.2